MIIERRQPREMSLVAFIPLSERVYVTPTCTKQNTMYSYMADTIEEQAALSLGESIPCTKAPRKQCSLTEKPGAQLLSL